VDLPSWVPSLLSSSFASFAGAHRALDFVTMMVEADGGLSYRLGNCDPALSPDRQYRSALQIFRLNKRSLDQTKKSAQLGTKRRLLSRKPHTTLLNNPLAPNLCVPPRRRLVVTVMAEPRPTRNDPEVALRTVLIQERRSRWSIRIFNTLLVLPLLAASPRRAMMVLPRLGDVMAILRRRQHWILSMVTRLMVVRIVSISFSINLASGLCVRCM
jgi:hypothetical protein